MDCAVDSSVDQGVDHANRAEPNAVGAFPSVVYAPSMVIGPLHAAGGIVARSTKEFSTDSAYLRVSPSRCWYPSMMVCHNGAVYALCRDAELRSVTTAHRVSDFVHNFVMLSCVEREQLMRGEEHTACARGFNMCFYGTTHRIIVTTSGLGTGIRQPLLSGDANTVIIGSIIRPGLADALGAMRDCSSDVPDNSAYNGVHDIAVSRILDRSMDGGAVSIHLFVSYRDGAILHYEVSMRTVSCRPVFSVECVGICTRLCGESTVRLRSSAITTWSTPFEVFIASHSGSNGVAPPLVWGGSCSDIRRAFSRDSASGAPDGIWAISDALSAYAPLEGSNKYAYRFRDPRVELLGLTKDHAAIAFGFIDGVVDTADTRIDAKGAVSTILRVCSSPISISGCHAFDLRPISNTPVLHGAYAMEWSWPCNRIVVLRNSTPASVAIMPIFTAPGEPLYNDPHYASASLMDIATLRILSGCIPRQWDPVRSRVRVRDYVFADMSRLCSYTEVLDDIADFKDGANTPPIGIGVEALDISHITLRYTHTRPQLITMTLTSGRLPGGTEGILIDLIGWNLFPVKTPCISGPSDDVFLPCSLSCRSVSGLAWSGQWIAGMSSGVVRPERVALPVESVCAVISTTQNASFGGIACVTSKESSSGPRHTVVEFSVIRPSTNGSRVIGVQNQLSMTIADAVSIGDVTSVFYDDATNPAHVFTGHSSGAIAMWSILKTTDVIQQRSLCRDASNCSLPFGMNIPSSLSGPCVVIPPGHGESAIYDSAIVCCVVSPNGVVAYINTGGSLVVASVPDASHQSGAAPKFSLFFDARMASSNSSGRKPSGVSMAISENGRIVVVLTSGFFLSCFVCGYGPKPVWIRPLFHPVHLSPIARPVFSFGDMLISIETCFTTKMCDPGVPLFCVQTGEPVVHAVRAASSRHLVQSAFKRSQCSLEYFTVCASDDVFVVCDIPGSDRSAGAGLDFLPGFPDISGCIVANVGGVPVFGTMAAHHDDKSARLSVHPRVDLMRGGARPSAESLETQFYETMRRQTMWYCGIFGAELSSVHMALIAIVLDDVCMLSDVLSTGSARVIGAVIGGTAILHIALILGRFECAGLLMLNGARADCQSSRTGLATSHAVERDVRLSSLAYPLPVTNKLDAGVMACPVSMSCATSPYIAVSMTWALYAASAIKSVSLDGLSSFGTTVALTMQQFRAGLSMHARAGESGDLHVGVDLMGPRATGCVPGKAVISAADADRMYSRLSCGVVLGQSARNWEQNINAMRARHEAVTTSIRAHSAELSDTKRLLATTYASVAAISSVPQDVRFALIVPVYYLKYGGEPIHRAGASSSTGGATGPSNHEAIALMQSVVDTSFVAKVDLKMYRQVNRASRGFSPSDPRFCEPIPSSVSGLVVKELRWIYDAHAATAYETKKQMLAWRMRDVKLPPERHPAGFMPSTHPDVHLDLSRLYELAGADRFVQPVNELIVFHGVPDYDVAMSIIREGFDPRLAVADSLYGPGIYSTCSISKAETYCVGEGRKARGDIFVLVCKVILGPMHFHLGTNSKFTRPGCVAFPQCTNERLCAHMRCESSAVISRIHSTPIPEDKRFLFYGVQNCNLFCQYVTYRPESILPIALLRLQRVFSVDAAK